MPTQLVIVGTRPEAIKLAPVVLAARSVHPEWTTLVAMTGQHDELAARPLATFGVAPDIARAPTGHVSDGVGVGYHGSDWWVHRNI